MATVLATSVLAYVLMGIFAMFVAVLISVIVWALAVVGRRRADPTTTAEAAAPVSAAPEPALGPGVVVAIAAAVGAVITGPHRIVHIREVGSSSSWALSGRQRHHLSHSPHRPMRVP